MADAQPGQQWTHGWVPLTPTAAKSKNHGKKPPPNSAIARVVAEAAAAAKNLRSNARAKAGPDGTPAPKWTGIGRPSAPAKSPAKAPAKAPTKAPAKAPKAAVPKATAPKAAPKVAAPQPAAKTPTKTATKPAAKAPNAGAKAGTDSHGKALRVGDEVAIRGGAHQGKTGKVAGKGPAGSLKVQVDGGDEIAIDGMNVRNRADHETSRSADTALRKAAGRPDTSAAPTAPQGQPSIAAVQGQVRDVYDQLAKKPGDWVSITKMRERMSNGLDRAHVDDALRLMNRMPGVNFTPESNQKTLRPADRAAALSLGDQEKHFISIGH